MTLDQARASLSRDDRPGVVYVPPGGGRREDGVIIRVGEIYVFVLYAGDLTPKATHPQDLTLLAGGRS